MEEKLRGGKLHAKFSWLLRKFSFVINVTKLSHGFLQQSFKSFFLRNLW